MAQEGGKQQNTAYGVFVQACWAQHKRQYPDELIHKEIEEFNKQCSVWWYNLSEQERERFQEMADRSNAQQALQQSYTTHVNNANTIHTNSSLVQNAVSSTSAGGIPSFGSSFTYSDYGIQGAGGQVVNAVVDQTGTVLNYSTNSAPGGQMVQQRTVMGQVQHRPGQQVVQQTGKGGKPMKDPNAPKKPLSAYFLFSQEERLKVKAEFPDYSITEVAKELGRRWAQIDPAIKQSYEQRYQESRRQYEQALQAYKPQKKKKDPNAPKQPLSAYFLFSQEERLKVKEGHPNYSICEIAKELGRRWADMNPEVKQHYQQKAEEGRQKYDQEMAAYRQGNFVRQDVVKTTNTSYNPSNENQAITNKSGQLSGLGLTAGTGQGLLMAAATVGSGGLDSEGLPPGVPVRVPPQQAQAQQAMFPGTDYSRLLH